MAILRYTCLEPFLDQAKYSVIGHPMLDELKSSIRGSCYRRSLDVRIEHPVHLLPLQSNRERIERLMRTATRTEPVGEALEVDLINLIEDRHHCLLDDFVFQRRHGQCKLHLTAVRIWDGRRYVIRSIHFEDSVSKYSSGDV